MTLNITPIGLHSQHAQDYPIVILATHRGIHIRHVAAAVTPTTLTRWAADLRTTAAAKRPDPTMDDTQQQDLPA